LPYFLQNFCFYGEKFPGKEAFKTIDIIKKPTGAEISTLIGSELNNQQNHKKCI